MDLSTLRPWLILAGAIGCEVTGTIALKASQGLSRPGPAVLVVLGYASAFWLLSLSLKSLPIGVVYGTWSGAGTIAAAVAGVLLFREDFTWMQATGVALIVGGVVLLKGVGG